MKRHDEYDLLAVGGGTAGLVSAAGGAYLGVRSAITTNFADGGAGAVELARANRLDWMNNVICPSPT